MKKLLMTIAVVMLLAVPAMAVDEFDVGKPTDVLLVIEAYVTFNVPSEVTVTVSESGNMSPQTDVPVTMYTNIPITVKASISPIGDSVADWNCSMWDPDANARTAMGATAQANYDKCLGGDPDIHVQATGIGGVDYQTATKDATLTVTISQT